ncbi:MAG TPA: amidohydrolase, partial [Pirellulales bacterium]|nr:amidohydrolase [Pirellulales bacterium]
MRIVPVVLLALILSYAGCDRRQPDPGQTPLIRSQPTGGAPQSENDAPLAKTGRAVPELPLADFRPHSMLRVEEHHLARAKFPVVDVHVHPGIRWHQSTQVLDDFVKLMDDQNIAVCVSLDGGMGERFLAHRDFLWTKYRQRWVIFANVDWRGSGDPEQPASWDCQRPGFAER